MAQRPLVELLGEEPGGGEEAHDAEQHHRGQTWRDLAFPSTRDALQDYVEKHLNSEGIRPPSSSVPR